MIKFPNFFVSAAVGTGHSRETDVKRTRRALRKTGHGRSPPTPSGRYDSSIARNIARMQTDFGLEPDGVIESDGPTARTMDMALDVLQTDGRETLEAVRGPYAALGRAGFRFQPDADDPTAPGTWRDREGNDATDARIRAAIREGEKRGEVKVARLFGGDRFALPATAPGIERISRKLFGSFAHIDGTERKLEPFGQPRSAESSLSERESMLEPTARPEATPQTTEPSKRPSLLTAASGSPSNPAQQVKPLARPPIIPVPAYKRFVFRPRLHEWTQWTRAVRALPSTTVAEERVYLEIYAAEGGLQKDPNSSAFAGILQKTLDEMVGKPPLSHIKRGTSVQALRQEHRAQVYRTYFDTRLDHASGHRTFEKLRDNEAAAALADTLFVHGKAGGAKIIQRAINSLSANKVSIDDAVGTQTIGAFNALLNNSSSRRSLLDAVADERMKLRPDLKERIDHFRFQKSSGSTGPT